MIITSLVVGFAIPSSVTGTADSISASYTDVNKSNSHYYNIIAANHLLFMTGFPDGLFKPNMELTRGNVVKALGKYITATNGKSIFHLASLYHIVVFATIVLVPCDCEFLPNFEPVPFP